jgi:hypothetical protein
VDSASGLRADAACDGAVQAPFIRGSVPAAGVSCAPAEVQSDFPTAAPSPGEDPISRFLKRLFD